jgi:hypothetical protein
MSAYEYAIGRLHAKQMGGDYRKLKRPIYKSGIMSTEPTDNPEKNIPQQAVIKDARDYAIRKGKILERFQQDFYTKHRRNPLYINVLEALIRDADPYEIIEKLIDVNAEHYALIMEMTPWLSPNYATWKNNQPKP